VHNGEQDIERSWRRRPGDWKSAALTMVASEANLDQSKKMARSSINAQSVTVAV
jgi:hypothetical protein